VTGFLSPAGAFLRGRARWVCLVAGLVVAVVDVVAARALGLTFELSGRDVTALVWLYLAISFGGLGYLVGWLLELRRRERLALAEASAAVEETRRQTEALERARLGLAQSEKLAALGQLSASISHEVRNPLAILRSMVQNMEEDAANAEEVRRSCGFLREEIDRLGRVTSSILGFARPVEPRVEPVGARELLERVRQLAPLEVREKGLMLEILDRSEGAAVEADPDLLAQALLGLVANAAQAAPAGTAVTLEARAASDEVVLAVLDRGPGVPRPDRERIFEPFFSTREEGHGLGLAVVRQIARAHGSAVRVGDHDGGGASFSIALPRRGGAPSTAAPSEARAAGAPSRYGMESL
jgi:signal transduction histidine kinase